MSRVLFFLVITILSSCSTGTFSLRESNDFLSLGQSDKNFSQGLDLEFTTNDSENLLSDISGILPSFSPASPDVHHSSFLAGQQIYTPDNLAATELQVNDNPYAGWLYGQLTRYSKVEDVRMSTSLSLGVVGPSARAEQIQTWVHELCNCTIPEGWDNQLRDEPAILLSHARRWPDDGGVLFGTFEWDSYSEIEFRAGNVHTDIKTGKVFRLGDIGAGEKFVSYGFVRFGSYVVARNIFYDGNSFKDSHKVDTQPVVGYFTPGFHTEYKGFGVDVSFVFRSKDYEEQKGEFNTFGLISIGFFPSEF